MEYLRELDVLNVSPDLVNKQGSIMLVLMTRMSNY